MSSGRGDVSARIAGGLLGHWAVWAKRAVEQLEEAHHIRREGCPVPQEMLSLAAAVTDCNAAFVKENLDRCSRIEGAITPPVSSPTCLAGNSR